MGNYKRDLIIIIILLITLLHGCLYSENITSISTFETDTDGIYSQDYFIKTIEEVFTALNKRSINKAENLLEVFQNVKPGIEIDILVNLAHGIIMLEKEKYDIASSYFEKAYPLKEAVAGLIYCNLEHRRINNFDIIEQLYENLNTDFSSSIYDFFSAELIESMTLYKDFWISYDETTSNKVLYLMEKNSTGIKNYLIDRILSNIISTSNNMQQL